MRTAFKARFIFPVSSPPIADGVVTIERGRIAEIGRDAVGCPVTDLGNVAILPGLINAHTHLEFSGLPSPLGTPGMPLPQWIRRVVDYRRRLPIPFNVTDIEKGVFECRSTGTVAVGEVATSDSGNAVCQVLFNTTSFREVIGLKRELIDSKLAVARKHLADSRRQWRPGLSPHAPYSVHPELFERLLDLAEEAQAPIAFHLAESLEELDLLATSGGPFRELLIELGAWDETAIPRGTRPIDYLRRLANRDVHSLIVHGNYLDDEEIGFVAAHAERMAVVYCPRTHAYFGHPRHPLPRLLAAGASVALGTDSRASNPDLNLLEEIRYVARNFAELPPCTALELGTLRAARALQLDKRFGTLEPGKDAALVSVPLPNGDATDPHWLIYDSSQPAVPLVYR